MIAVNDNVNNNNIVSVLNRSSLFCIKHERHECDTSNTNVTRVRHKRHEGKTSDTSDMSATRVLHEQHKCDMSATFDFDNNTSENIFPHPYVNYMGNERLQGEEQFHTEN